MGIRSPAFSKQVRPDMTLATRCRTGGACDHCLFSKSYVCAEELESTCVLSTLGNRMVGRRSLVHRDGQGGQTYLFTRMRSCFTFTHHHSFPSLGGWADWRSCCWFCNSRQRFESETGSILASKGACYVNQCRHYS